MGDWMRDDGLERKTGELDEPLVSLARLDVEALNNGVIVLGLLVMLALSPVLSSLLCDAGNLSFPPATASLNRVYSPLKPFCISSSVMPLVSVPEEEAGGDANSLKVVRLSEWQAVLCMASRAWASSSLSTCPVLGKDANEPLLDRDPIGILRVVVDALPDVLDDIL